MDDTAAIKKKKKEKPPKPKYNMWQNSGFMIALAWKNEKKVLALLLLGALISVASSLVNLFVAPSILSAVENRVSIPALLGTIAIFTGLMMFFGAAGSYVGQNTLFGRISIRSKIISMLNDKTATTSYPNVEDDKFKKLSDKSSQATSGNDQATEAVWGTLEGLLKNVLGFAVYLALLTSVEPALLLVILATTAGGYFIGRHINGWGYRHRDEESDCYKKLSYIDERAKDFAAAKDIRIFNLRPWLSELYEKSMAALDAFNRRAQSVYIWGGVADLLLAFLRNGVAYAYLISMVLRDGLTASQFLLYFSAVGGFTGWMSGILGDLGTLYRQSLDLSTVRECLDYPEPFRFEDGERLEPKPGGGYELRMRDVSYRYPGADRDVLSHIDLTLRPGEKLAVVGLNGAGKTTLVKLLCGFVDPTSGEVLLDGRDIRSYDRRDYYKLFSAVFQDFSLLASTAAANIAQTEDGIDMEKVADCAEKAGLTEKLESLPKKYETHLYREIYEDAAMLSGGETQRLMLARALYKDAPIVVLDEPTAALDPIAEADLYGKYGEMTRGKSSVYISHRLASTRFCDRIILIENAGIAEEGTHDELLAKGGRYAELFEIQSKYYRDGKLDGAEDDNDEEEK